jgi:hypothetical protein
VLAALGFGEGPQPSYIAVPSVQAAKGHAACLAQLAELGADVNMVDKAGRSASPWHSWNTPRSLCRPAARARCLPSSTAVPTWQRPTPLAPPPCTWPLGMGGWRCEALVAACILDVVTQAFCAARAVSSMLAGLALSLGRPFRASHDRLVCPFLQVLKALLEAGAPVTVATNMGAHPLHLAAAQVRTAHNPARPHLTVCMLVLRPLTRPSYAGPCSHRLNKITAKNSLAAQTLMLAVVTHTFEPTIRHKYPRMQGQEESVRALVEAGAAMNAPNAKGDTALHLACGAGHTGEQE